MGVRDTYQRCRPRQGNHSQPIGKFPRENFGRDQVSNSKSASRGQGVDLFSDCFKHSMSTDPESRKGFGPYLAGVGPTYKDQNGTVQTIRYGHIEDFKRALDHFGKNVAAFLLEPIQGEAGYVHSDTCLLPLSRSLQASSFHRRGICGRFVGCARRGMFFLSATKSKRSVPLSATILSDAEHQLV